MNKLLFSAILLGTTLFGADGYKVYKENCASCHIEMINKKELIKNLANVKAPPMVEVSGRLKANIRTTDEEDEVNRHLFILFVKDYIINPNLDFSMCNPGALERFGTMPSQKSKINAEEAKAVAQWLYDRYEDIEFK